jgi:cytosine/adenosine deaminase-related metal-dependent hydrolase
MTRIVRAAHLFAGDAPPVRDGAVVVDAGGSILDVGPAAELAARHAGLPVERVRGALLPGLVNAHTHVELSALRGRVPGGRGFAPWAEVLVPARRALSAEEERDGIARAVDELAASGTVAVGDVTNGLGAVRQMVEAGLAGCIFHEVFGALHEPAMARAVALAGEAARVSSWGELTWAPAPHTLYTTHPNVVRHLVAEARALGRKTTLHLLEHAAEREAIERGAGLVPKWLERFAKVPRGAQTWPCRPVLDVAEALGALGPDVLLVHLVDARADELARIAERGAPVVFCPRSNLHIEGRMPPVEAALAAGIEPALGTDSLASSASLDVMEEARLLRERIPSLSPATLLRMATWNGARALARPDLGRIAKGARPGLLAVDVPEGADAWAHVLSSAPSARRRLDPRTSP